MFDLKEINEAAKVLEERKGLKKEVIFGAIEEALAAAYKKEYGERGEIVKAKFNKETGEVEYYQVKIVLSKENVLTDDDVDKLTKEEYLKKKDEGKTRFISERHIMIDTAKLIKKDVVLGEEIAFPLETKGNFSRVAAQTAKQAIMRAIKDAEKNQLLEKFGHLENTIITGEVLKVEPDTKDIHIRLEDVEAILPFAEQIKKEKYKTGDKIKAVLILTEAVGRGISLKLSRTHPEFLKQLYIEEVPELGDRSIEIKNISREPGFRAKVAVALNEGDLDLIGTLVGQGGSRVNAVSSELSGERIDIIEWSENKEDFIEDALSPAEIISIKMIEDDKAEVVVSDDQFSLAIGRGGQNVRLAAMLTGTKIDIKKEEELEGKE